MDFPLLSSLLARRAWASVGLPLVAVLLSFSASAAPAVWGESAMVKVRPSLAPRADEGVDLVAARNEFVSFQVVVHGGEAGARGVRAHLPALEGAGRIDGAHVTLYREAFLNITQSSGARGETGLWPDPLVPDVDEVAGESRRAFPFDVPAGEARAIWVDVLVPEDATAGSYTGSVQVEGEGLQVQVPVRLNVVPVTLPSTSSLASAFLIHFPNVCRAHTGTDDCGGARPTADLLARYARMALEHRITLTNIFALPQGGDWKAFDAEYTPLMEGMAATRLKGARMTSAMYMGKKEGPLLAAFAEHFAQKGWLSRAFDYSGDEPPWGISWEEAQRRLHLVRESAPTLRTLLTTNVVSAQENGLGSLVDVMVPVVNHLDGAEEGFLGSQRPLYEDFLAQSNRSLWAYQSCMSQGCGYGSNSPENQGDTGWPSYMVDRSAAKNRAMQWVLFNQRATGELYYETALALTTAWQDVFQYNGNGDGTLFYPGTPDVIGGNTHVPVASIRLKHIRQGMQDYEWLKLVADAGDAPFAHQLAQSLIPSAYKVGEDGAAFDRARRLLISRYLELAPPPAVAQPGPGSEPDAPGEKPATTQPVLNGNAGSTTAGLTSLGRMGCSAAGAAPTGLGLLLALVALRLRSRRRS